MAKLYIHTYIHTFLGDHRKVRWTCPLRPVHVKAPPWTELQKHGAEHDIFMLCKAKFSEREILSAVGSGTKGKFLRSSKMGAALTVGHAVCLTSLSIQVELLLYFWPWPNGGDGELSCCRVYFTN